jgi:hypothetical protein
MLALVMSLHDSNEEFINLSIGQGRVVLLLSVELRQYVLILLTVHCFCNFNIEVINYDWHMRKCESYSRLITACPSSFEKMCQKV